MIAIRHDLGDSNLGTEWEGKSWKEQEGLDHVVDRIKVVFLFVS